MYVFAYIFKVNQLKGKPKINRNGYLSERGKVDAKSYFYEYTLFYDSNFGTTTFIFIEF